MKNSNMSVKNGHSSKIAILLATYNGQQYLPEMLDSLVNQTEQNFICYIHDDGSVDNTDSVIRSYTEKYPTRFYEISGASTGSAKSNFMYLLTQVEADYYMFADQDDVWLPDKIEKSFRCLRENNAWCVSTELCVTDEKLNTIAPNMMTWIGRDLSRIHPHQLLIDNVAVGCTMLFTRELRDIAIQLQNVDKILMHDQWVAVLAAMYGKLTVQNESTILYRQHGDNEMGAKHENAVTKLQRFVRELLSGTMLKEKKAFIQEARDLAQELLLVKGLPGKELPQEERLFLQEFAHIGRKTKSKRIAFYKANNLNRKSRFSTLWMWLWV